MKYALPAAILIVMVSALAFTTVFAAEADASGTSTATMSISGQEAVSTQESGSYDVIFNEQTPYDTSSFDLTYTATLYKGGNAISNAVSPSTGSMTNNVSKTFTVSQQGAGTYELRIVFVEKVTFEGDDEVQVLEHTVTKKIRFIDPLKFQIELKNSGSIDLTDAHVVFYLDGTLLEDSATDVSVKAGETQTVSYSYLPADLSKGKHTYYLEATDGSIIDGIGADHAKAFYYKQGSYDMLNWVGIIMLVAFTLLLAWVLTKPVKNFGKPKARKAKKV